MAEELGLSNRNTIYYYFLNCVIKFPIYQKILLKSYSEHIFKIQLYYNEVESERTTIDCISE
jgi:hypothetical protein